MLHQTCFLVVVVVVAAFGPFVLACVLVEMQQQRSSLPFAARLHCSFDRLCLALDALLLLLLVLVLVLLVLVHVMLMLHALAAAWKQEQQEQ